MHDRIQRRRTMVEQQRIAKTVEELEKAAVVLTNFGQEFGADEMVRAISLNADLIVKLRSGRCTQAEMATVFAAFSDVLLVVEARAREYQQVLLQLTERIRF